MTGCEDMAEEIFHLFIDLSREQRIQILTKSGNQDTQTILRSFEIQN